MHLFCFPVPPFCDIILTHCDLHQATLCMAIAAAASEQSSVLLHCHVHCAACLAGTGWPLFTLIYSVSQGSGLRAQGSLFQLGRVSGVPRKFPSSSFCSVMGHMFIAKMSMCTEGRLVSGPLSLDLIFWVDKI